MPQYMIEFSHSPDECIQALHEIEPWANDLLDDIYWGCLSGRHDGWAVVEAENEEQAKEMIPDAIRGAVKITRVTGYMPELEHGIDPEAKNPGRMEPSGT